VNRVTVAGLACGLALLLATACSSTRGGLPTNGSFGNGGPNSGTVGQCVPPGQVAYSGFEDFPNTGGTATIDRVTLVDPRHLHLVAAWVIPTPNPGVGVGVGQGYPTASSVASDTPGLRWEFRQRIPGAVVRHTRGQESINLVIVIKPSGNVGTAKAIDLYYQTAGTHYLLQAVKLGVGGGVQLNGKRRGYPAGRARRR
jgi:hypothetical protein